MKHKNFYMGVAELAAQNSHAKRKKVGCCIVTKNKTLLTGWNGTVAGDSNDCECVASKYDREGLTSLELVTLPTVSHSEMNAISKAARDGISLVGSTLFVTLSPCIECSKMIIQSGVKKVVYKEEYRDTNGIDFLKRFIKVEKYEQL